MRNEISYGGDSTGYYIGVRSDLDMEELKSRIGEPNKNIG